MEISLIQKHFILFIRIIFLFLRKENSVLSHKLARMAKSRTQNLTTYIHFLPPLPFPFPPLPPLPPLPPFLCPLLPPLPPLSFVRFGALMGSLMEGSFSTLHRSDN